jgi:hypothetical protein
MALKAIIDSIDGLSEDVKKEYKPGEGKLQGKFVLDVAEVDGFALDNVGTLKTTLQKERETVATLKKSVKAFDGLDAAQAREALEKLEEIKNFNPDQKITEGIRQREEQLSKKWKKEVDDREEAIKATTKQLEEVLIDNAAVKALSEAKGSAKLLLPHVKTRTRLRKTDAGQYVVEVVDENGTARISPKAGSQDPMTISELISEMRGSDDYASAFAASGANGSGAPPAGGATGGNSSPVRSAGGKATKTIAISDKDAIAANIDGIADGSVVVSGI